MAETELPQMSKVRFSKGAVEVRTVGPDGSPTSWRKEGESSESGHLKAPSGSRSRASTESADSTFNQTSSMVSTGLGEDRLESNSRGAFCSIARCQVLQSLYYR